MIGGEGVLVYKKSINDKTIIKIGDKQIGGDKITLIAGPCSVEGKEEYLKTVIPLKDNVDFFRGGAYKPRTSPYDFQGLGIDGLKILAEARKITGVPIVTEIMSEYDIEIVTAYTDIIQVGSRNMHNYSLLKRLSKIDKPVLLKRGMAATIDEWLMSAEYILSGGNKNVILCERGIRTFANYTRNTLDISAIPVLKEKTHLPIFVDPSHATGNSNWVSAMCLASIAAGVDGLLIEIHHDPDNALSDGKQSLNINEFNELVMKINKIFIEKLNGF